MPIWPKKRRLKGEFLSFSQIPQHSTEDGHRYRVSDYFSIHLTHDHERMRSGFRKNCLSLFICTNTIIRVGLDDKLEKLVVQFDHHIFNLR
jgi:hypothetical protein